MIHGLFKVKPISALPAHTSSQSLAEDFSKYFSSKIQILKRDNLQSSNLSSMNMSVTIDRPSCQRTFSEFITASDSTIKNFLCIVNPNLVCSIPYQRKSLSNLSITKLINASLISGVFPASLKKGIIRPSIKKQVADNIQEVVLVLLDLSSAFDFDTIDHTLLLERLHHRYGMCGTVRKWFLSYLANHSQSVRIKDAASPDKSLLYAECPTIPISPGLSRFCLKIPTDPDATSVGIEKSRFWIPETYFRQINKETKYLTWIWLKVKVWTKKNCK